MVTSPWKFLITKTSSRPQPKIEISSHYTLSNWHFLEILDTVDILTCLYIINSRLAQCWPTVEDIGPTLNQPWVNVSRLLPIPFWCYIAAKNNAKWKWCLEKYTIFSVIVFMLSMCKCCLPARYAASTMDAVDRVWLSITKNSSSAACKWNESGFRPPLCTCRLNWARRTSWGWWDDWDDTVLQTQDSKFEPWRSEAEHATSGSRRLPTILIFTRGWGRNIFVSFKPPRPGTEPRTLAWKAAVLTTTLGPPPQPPASKYSEISASASHWCENIKTVCADHDHSRF